MDISPFGVAAQLLLQQGNQEVTLNLWIYWAISTGERNEFGELLFWFQIS